MLKWTARLFAVAMVIGLVSSTAMAAKGPNEPNRPKHQMREQRQPTQFSTDRRMKMLTERLSLTEKQQGEVKPIVQEQMQQMQALLKDQSVAPEQRRTRMQEIRKEYNGKIEQLLTPEQKEKFKKMQEDQGAKPAGERGKGKSPDANSKK